MYSIAVQIAIIAAIALSIFLGSKFKINIGIIAIAFAYIIACFFMNKSTVELISYWPVRSTFLQIGVGFFYGFAIVNGTMDKLSRKLIYPFRNKPKLIPFAIFFICAILTAIGADSLSVVLFMGTLGMSIAQDIDMDPILICIGVVMGVPAGNSAPWVSTGVLLRGYLEASFPLNTAANYAARGSVAVLVTFTVVFTIMYFLYKGYKCNSMQYMDKPESFNKNQKKTLVLVLASIGILIIPQFLVKFISNNVLNFFAGKIDIYGIVYIFGLICACLKLGDEKEVISKKIPWNIILTVAGVSILIELGTEAGMVDTFLALLNESIPSGIVFAAVTLIAALMSMFSNSLMVVGILAPFMTKLSILIGLSNPSSLIISTILGAYCSDVAPFSTGGSLILTLAENEAQRTTLFKRFFYNVFVIIAIVTLMSAIGWFSLF